MTKNKAPINFFILQCLIKNNFRLYIFYSIYSAGVDSSASEASVEGVVVSVASFVSLVSVASAPSSSTSATGLMSSTKTPSSMSMLMIWPVVLSHRCVIQDISIQTTEEIKRTMRTSRTCLHSRPSRGLLSRHSTATCSFYEASTCCAGEVTPTAHAVWLGPEKNLELHQVWLVALG